MFAHAFEKRFKVGHSVLPLGRLANLPEAHQIDHVQSFRLEFPDRRRARQVESMLHKALASFRLELASLIASTFSQQRVKAWDGSTEWFSMSGMHHVMDLLNALPEFLPTQQISLETLDGKPYVVDTPLKFQKESDRRRCEARLYNLERLDHICNSVMQIKRHLKISWHDSKSCKDPNGSSVGSLPTGGILRVHGFRRWWDLDNLAPRMGITDHALWNLKTGTITAFQKCYLKDSKCKNSCTISQSAKMRTN